MSWCSRAKLFNIGATPFDNEKMRPCSDAMSEGQKVILFNIEEIPFNTEKMPSRRSTPVQVGRLVFIEHFCRVVNPHFICKFPFKERKQRRERMARTRLKRHCGPDPQSQPAAVVVSVLRMEISTSTLFFNNSLLLIVNDIINIGQ
jgi:hypothetical protein